MDRCLIDIETKSPLDIRKTSGYGYARECEIILVSFAWNDEPVRQIDFTDPNRDPLEVLTLLKILTDPNVIKMAHNAAFEWAVFNACGHETPIDQWQDTMAHAMYLSYPASLEAAGKALGLSEDKLKMSEGKTLIRYFCQPTKDGTYRSPSVNPERWEIFKEYNRRDVETEREIQRRLDRFPMPEEEIERWRNDILMNNYGVPIDLQLLRGALYMIAESGAELMAEAKALTGLDNPNSTQQLIPWLTSHECKVTNLTKDTVADALSGDLDANVRRVLEIRQELSKTSVKKYGAIDDALCIDGRVRGISMYYGATRSGRWCLTGDHEVMTPSGWVRLDAWSGGDILVWNKDLEMFSFQKSTPVSFSYSGDMVRYESKRCDQIATPEHKMPVLNKDGSWEVKTVGEIGRRRVTIPFTGRRTINYPLDNYELRVLIMTQADGHYTREGHLRFRFKKHRKIERCKMLLRRAGISFAFHEYSDASVVTVPRTQLPLWLRTFRDKTFGYWLLDENPAVLFDELAMWDGYRVTDNSVQYSTTNKQNADVIQMCAVCGGYSVNVRVKERINKNWSTAYVVDIWTKPGKGTIITERQITTIQHDGRVYCAETPTGFFVTRRNGKVWVTGNSGRLIQLQNLTKHHIGTLDEARALVSAGEYSATKMVYGNIYSLLSQIVRTVLVPSDGRKFVVADFSAIEARVIAWLAGEQWVNEVFATHGRIYEATAAQMFHVPIETIVKGHENYDLRQKGKVATLACIAEGQLVLTDRGLVPIEHVTLDMRVWDGEEWVSHNGVVFRGEKEVIEYDGLVATGDHIVYIKTADGKHREVSFGYAAASRSCVEKSGAGWKTIRVVEDINGRAKVRKGLVTMQGTDGMCRVRESRVDVSRKHDARKDQRVSSVQPTTEDTEMVTQTIYGSETAVRESEIARVQELRSEGYKVRVRERNGSGPVYVGGERVSDEPKNGNRPNRQRWELCQGESSVGDAKRAASEPKTLKKVPVYDIVDAGPRHRYTVSNCLVHNCGYGGGVNALTAMDPGGMIPDEDKQGIIDRWRSANPHIVSLWRDMEDAAVSVVQYGGAKDVRGGLVQLALEVDELYGLSFMTMRLPSGRKLYYAKPFLKENRFGKMSVHHYGVGTTKKWEEQNTYSGKLTENCIQAIARDCLAVTLDRVKANGWDVVFHVHDEVVIDAPMDLTVDTVCDLMSEPISWAPGLVLKAAGFESHYYKKD